MWGGGGGGTTYEGYLGPKSSINKSKHGVPHKRAYQPAKGTRGCGREPEHDERVQPVDAVAQGFNVLLAQDRDAAGGGAERGGDACDQVVVAARAPQLQVFVPGERVGAGFLRVELRSRARGESGDVGRCDCWRGSGRG